MGNIMNAKTKSFSLLDTQNLRRTLIDAFVKLNPLHLIKNPVMFVVEIGCILTTLLFFQAFFGHGEERTSFILAISLWLSALNVQYRDVQYMIPFLVQAWMFASPIAYSGNLIPAGPARLLYGLNPMAGVIQGFRWALLGASAPDGMMVVSMAVVLILLVSGLWYFRRMEDTFADVV